MVKCLHYKVIYRCKICSTSPRLYGEKTPSLAACITALINVLEALTFCCKEKKRAFCVCSGNKNSSKLQISSFFFSPIFPLLFSSSLFSSSFILLKPFQTFGTCCLFCCGSVGHEISLWWEHNGRVQSRPAVFKCDRTPLLLHFQL